MSNKKHLLEEGTVRKFMGLAGLKPVTVSNFVNEEYVNEEDETTKEAKKSRYEEDTELDEELDEEMEEDLYEELKSHYEEME